MLAKIPEVEDAKNPGVEAAGIPDEADDDNPGVCGIEETVPDPEEDAESFGGGWYLGC